MIEIQKIPSDSKLMKTVFSIREEVFVVEQEVDPSIEYEFEEESVHFLALFNGEPAGTARWRQTNNGIKLERFAVLKTMREKGIGSALVKAIMDDLAGLKSLHKIYLHAQVTAMNLYAKHNFVAEGDEFLEADIRHYVMVWKA